MLIRRLTGRRAAEQAAIILANLDVVSEDLDSGAVVVLTDEWVRVRRLPIVGPQVTHSVGLVVSDREPITPLVRALTAAARQLSEGLRE